MALPEVLRACESLEIYASISTPIAVRGCDFIHSYKTSSSFAPQKCVNEAFVRGAKGDNKKITASERATQQMLRKMTVRFRQR